MATAATIQAFAAFQLSGFRVIKGKAATMAVATASHASRKPARFVEALNANSPREK